MKELSEYSVAIGENIPVTFEKVQYQTGETNFKKWYCLTFIFKDSMGKYLSKRLMEPSIENLQYCANYAGVLSQVIDNFEKNGWEKIPRCKNWNDFYNIYLKEVQKHFGKNCFIKTIPITEEGNYKNCTADLTNKFISSKANMAYDVMEHNQASDYLMHNVTVSEEKRNNYSEHF